jgi:hypothetical protein
MSGGHTVLRAQTVVQNFPLRIEAADAWGDALVVGTSDGALLVFAAAEPVAGTPRHTPPEEAPAPRYEARGSTRTSHTRTLLPCAHTAAWRAVHAKQP